jgi:PBP1b-binding outer membrane lipoprotein LpoB
MKLIPLILIIALALTSCHYPHKGKPGNGTDSTGNGSGATLGTQAISIDTANMMIGSYLKSINCPAVDTNINSLIVNADTLRKYLTDTTIKNIKLMFAQPTSFIATAGYGAYAGYSYNGVTLVIVGMNSSNNYVLNSPIHCPLTGTASNSLIVEAK